MGSKDQLFRLIKSLTKAEKRNFRLYAGRTGGAQPGKFVQLFDALDKMEDYQEDLLLRRLRPDGVLKHHLPNLKRHLYRQILTSLRLIHIQKQIDIEIREQIDFARILYGKGLYMDSLRILERTKNIAEKHHQDILHLEVIEFQKLIEARHITRSRQIDNKMDFLLNESARRSYVTLSTSELFNVNIQIHGYYIENGHARTPAERQAAAAYWRDIQPQQTSSPMTDTFFEKVNRFQSQMWYHYIQLDLERAWEKASDWVNLFLLDPEMTLKDPDLYMRSLYYLLVFSFLLDREDDHSRNLFRLGDFIDLHQESLNPNSQSIGLIYLNLSRYNHFFLQRDYVAAIGAVSGLEHTIDHEITTIDDHRRMLFYYKFAYAFFVSGDYDRALDYVNKILNNRGSFLRDDIHINTRLLALFCHYELDNLSFVDSELVNVQRLVTRSDESSPLHRLALALLRQLVRAPISERETVLQDGWCRLQQLATEPYERKSLRYFDLVGWMQKQLGMMPPEVPQSQERLQAKPVAKG